MKRFNSAQFAIVLTFSVSLASALCSAQQASSGHPSRDSFSVVTYPLPGESHAATAANASMPDQLASSDNTSATNPGATFKGCWYKQGSHKYQGIAVSVKNPGTYLFDSVLYHGTTCDTNDYADSLSQEYPFGSFGYIFWFDRFANQSNMSAIWNVGPNTSGCVKYTSSTPLCN